MSILYQNECKNGFRDVPQEYANQGHGFSLNKNDDCLLYSFDLCAACEAHALLHQLNKEFSRLLFPSESKILKWIKKKMELIFFLQDWDRTNLQEEEQIHFQICPGIKDEKF